MKKVERVAIDLFSGAGGMSCGLIKAGIEVRAAVESWSVAAETYSSNIGAGIVIEKDIREIKGKDILKKINIRKRRLFLLVGSPPCQGFSTQQRNKRGTEDKRNMLVFEYLRLIDEIKPMFIIMENVPGMTIEKEIFKKMVDELKKIGYEFDVKVINSVDYGVPQIRKRLILHGVREDIHTKMVKKGIKFGFPEQTHFKDGDLLEPARNNWSTVRDAIYHYPRINAGERSDIYPNHWCAGLKEINLKRIKIIRENGGSRTALPLELQLECHKKSKVGYKDVYGVMDWDKPAPTLTGGCTSLSKGRFGHPEQDRAISAREAAKIQTFDDDFVFRGNLQEVAKQIGNAVPVELARVCGQHFLEIGEKLNLL